MLWTIALIPFTLLLNVLVTSFRNLSGRFEGVYEETKDEVSRDAHTKLITGVKALGITAKVQNGELTSYKANLSIVFGLTDR
jgi:hypothetical protein